MVNDFNYDIDCFVTKPKTVLDVYNDHHRKTKFKLTYKEQVALALVYMHTKQQLKQAITVSNQTKVISPITYPKHLVEADHNDVLKFIQHCTEIDYALNGEKGLHLAWPSLRYPPSAILLEFNIETIDMHPSYYQQKAQSPNYEKD